MLQVAFATNKFCLKQCVANQPTHLCRELCNNGAILSIPSNSRHLQDEVVATPEPTALPTLSPTEFPTEIPTVLPTLSPTNSPTEEVALIRQYWYYFTGGSLCLLFLCGFAVFLVLGIVERRRERARYTVDVRPIAQPEYEPKTIKAQDVDGRHSNQQAFRRMMPSVSVQFKRARDLMPSHLWRSGKTDGPNTDITEAELEGYQPESATGNRNRRASSAESDVWGLFSGRLFKSNNTGKRKNKKKKSSFMGYVGELPKRQQRASNKDEDVGQTIDMFAERGFNLQVEQAVMKSSSSSRNKKFASVTSDDL